jgi:hypothetical protein
MLLASPRQTGQPATDQDLPTPNNQRTPTNGGLTHSDIGGLKLLAPRLCHGSQQKKNRAARMSCRGRTPIRGWSRQGRERPQMREVADPRSGATDPVGQLTGEPCANCTTQQRRDDNEAGEPCTHPKLLTDCNTAPLITVVPNHKEVPREHPPLPGAPPPGVVLLNLQLD